MQNFAQQLGITCDPMLDHTLYHAAQDEDRDFGTKNAQWVANLLHNANARPLFDAAHDAGIKGKEFLAFIAQCATESWDFKRFDENGDSSHLNQLYAHVNGNGDESSGDGYRYRGRGYIQLTGKGNYAAAGKAVGEDLVDNPDRAAEPSIAAKIATWFWEHRVHGKVSDYSNTSEVTQAIQGGTGDLKARRVRFNLLNQFMKLGDHLNKVLHQQQHKAPEVYAGDEDNTTH
jgi:predicted chitinase